MITQTQVGPVEQEEMEYERQRILGASAKYREMLPAYPNIDKDELRRVREILGLKPGDTDRHREELRRYADLETKLVPLREEVAELQKVRDEKDTAAKEAKRVFDIAKKEADDAGNGWYRATQLAGNVESEMNGLRQRNPNLLA